MADGAQAGESPSTCGAGRSLISFSFPNLTGAMEETGADIIIKKTSEHTKELYWASMQAHKWASRRIDALYIAFPLNVCQSGKLRRKK